jgi:hypothetical protein
MTTTRCADGHHEVRTKIFCIPAGDDTGTIAARKSLLVVDGSWSKPGDEYLTRAELHTYPLGAAGDDRAGTVSVVGSRLPPCAPIAEAVARMPDATDARRLDQHHGGRLRWGKWCVRCGTCGGCICLILILLVAFLAKNFQKRAAAGRCPLRSPCRGECIGAPKPLRLRRPNRSHMIRWRDTSCSCRATW